MRIGWTNEQVSSFLYQCYVSEVEARKRQLVITDELKEHILSISQWLCNGQKNSLLLAGAVGNGKTTMMRAIRTLVNYVQIERTDGAICSMPIIDTNELTRICRDDYNRFRKICKSDFLALDDLGREPVEVRDYGNVINPIVELIQYRYDEQLPIIITSNLTAEGIKERYGERIVDRFREMLKVITFNDHSFRKVQ